jgi:hypothetical protein
MEIEAGAVKCVTNDPECEMYAEGSGPAAGGSLNAKQIGGGLVAWAKTAEARRRRSSA